MPFHDPIPTKDKIIEAIKRRGPSLPVHIANEMKLSMLFASAFLADLLTNKELKISYMKVGNTPVYFIPGQEPQLENYAQHLKSREKDAFTILKEKKFLEDDSQEPAIRVALREIKDFAVPFQKNNKIIWRYFTIPEGEYKTEEPKEVEVKPESEKKETISEVKNQEAVPKEIIVEEKPKEINFINKVLNWLKTNEKIKLLEEIEVKKKEFLGIGRTESNLGETEVLVLAKDKKKITSKDLTKIEKKIIEYKRTAILFSNGEIDKKSLDDYRRLKNIILIKNI